MSAGIRQYVGPARMRLHTNLTDAHTLASRGPDLSVEEPDKLAARRWVSKAKGAMLKVQKDMSLIEEKNEAWQKVIESLDDDERPQEETLYGLWANGRPGPPPIEGFSVTLERGRVAIMELEAMITEVNETMAWTNGRPLVAAAAPPARDADHSTDNRIRLAPYELPPFNGSREDWWEFSQAFEAMVDQDNRLRPFEKLGMLKRATRDGKAHRLISALPITDANYPVAKNLLYEEYGNRQELIRSLNARLLALKPCHTTTQVRDFHQELESLCQQLESMGSGIQESEHVIELISAKLTKATNRELVTAQANFTSRPVNAGEPPPIWTAKEARHVLGQIVRREGLIERAYSTEHRPSSEASNPKRKEHGRAVKVEDSRFKPKPSSALAVNGTQADSSNSESDEWDEIESAEELVAVAKANPGERRNRPLRFRPAKCLFCDKEHWMSYCERYPDGERRLARLRELERCTRCFAKEHTSKKCATRIQCRRCDANDHKKPLCRKPIRDTSKTRQQNAKKDNRARGGVQAAPVNAADSESSAEDGWFEQPDSDYSVSSGVKLAAAKLPSSGKETTLLMCKKVMAFNPENGAAKREAVVFFDSGSTRSFISEGFAKELGLTLGKRSELELERFNDDLVSMTTWKTRVGVTTPKGKTLNLAIVTTPSIVRKAPAIQIDEDEAARLKNGKRVALRLAQANPDIMIGSDYFEHPFQVRWQMRTPGGFSVYKSKIGHLIFGRGTPDQVDGIAQVVVAAGVGRTKKRLPPDEAEREEEEEALVRQFLSLEGAGIHDDPRRDADREAVELVRQGMRINEEGRYEVPLPWRIPKELPPNNFGLALGRLRSTWRARKDKPEELNSYDRAIRKYPEQGAAERLENPEKADGPIHHIPHHGVLKKNGEVRIVFAANAKGRKWEYALNQVLLQGPAIGMKNLVGILLRSRLEDIVVIADIEGAFTQISVRIEDRDVMRFLWMKDPKEGPFGNNIEVYRFCRVMFGVVCSPFELGIVLTDHTAGYPTIAARKIEEELYVDNLHLFGEDPAKVRQWVGEAKNIMKDAHMHLREFASNKKEILVDIPEEDQLPEQRQKLLGITWDTKSDVYIFKSPAQGTGNDPYLVADEQKNTTKRQVLRAIAKHYDPLGLIAPILVSARLFFQQLCLNGIEWKEELNENQQEQWLSILEGWKGPEIQVPRQARRLKGKHELHIFADASGTTYAVAAYLRTTEGSQTEAHLIFAKSRVKPIEFCRRERDSDFTPRLELLAVEMAIRVLVNLRTELRLKLETPSYIWSDSSCTLGWLKSPERQAVFIENRLRKIRSTPDIVVRHVRSEDNPADLATRGNTVAELGYNRLWWRGPEWLEKSPESWPNEISTYDSREPQEISTEEEEHSLTKIWKALPAIIELDREKANIGPESWNEKVLERCKTNRGENCDADGPITAEERQKATTDLVRELQRDESLADSPNLRTFKDAEGIIRVNCGLENAPITEARKTPILLPKGSLVTRMIILDLHIRLNHAGVAITLRNMRELYWVPKGRRLVSNVIRRCEDCQPFLAKHYQQPRPPTLPGDRVRDEAPFRTTGLDYFGPSKLLVDKKHQRKHWTALFTCLATRSVHLELVDDLTAYSFLLALRRFIAIRGVPAVILSDNATTFKLGAKVVAEMTRVADLFQDDAVIAYSARVGITWKWITERAPWRGGAYEKMVDLVKRALRVVIGRKLLPREVFDTLLKEAAAIVNSRPISFLYESPTEPLPLRPMDFLQPWGGGQAIAGPDEDGPIGEPEETRQEAMVALWTRLNHRLELFWDAWRGDYLAWLRERAEIVRKGGRRGEPKVGTIVMLGDEPDTPRGTWPIGKITELVPSADGVVRTVKVTLPNKREVRRAVNMVYPLEAEPEEEAEAEKSPPPTAENKPPLKASTAGRDKRTQEAAQAKLHHYGLRSRKVPKASTVKAITLLTLICSLFPVLIQAHNQSMHNGTHGTRMKLWNQVRTPMRDMTRGEWNYWTRGSWKTRTDDKGLIGWSSGIGCLLDGSNEAQIRATFKLWTAFDRPPVAKGELNQSSINQLYDWASNRWHDKLIHHGFHQRPRSSPPPPTTPATRIDIRIPKERWFEKLPTYNTNTAILRGGLSAFGIGGRRKRIVGILLGVANLVIEGYLFHRINQLQDQINKLSLGGEFMEKLAEGLEREAQQRRLAMAEALMESAMESTLRTLTEMLQTGRIPPELLSSEGREEIINTALKDTNITRWTYLRFPTALSQFSRVDIENRGQAWFSRDQPRIRTVLTIPMLEDGPGNPLCGIFVRHLKHIGIPNGPHSLMRLDIPEEAVVFQDRVLGFYGSSCKHRTVEIDVCDPTRVATNWTMDGPCLTDNTSVLPWMTQHASERCHWEMVAQGHKECLSLIAQDTPTGEWKAQTNCRELRIKNGHGICRRIPLTGNWTTIRIVLTNDQVAELGDKEMKNLPNAPMDRAERVTLLKQSVIRQLAPRATNQTKPSLQEQIHEWRTNVSHPSVDPEEEVKGVFQNAVTAVTSVGKWLIERYQWLIAIALLCVFTPFLLWCCLQGCWYGCPQCIKCCGTCWRPRRRLPKKEKTVKSKGKETEDTELLEVPSPGEDTVAINTKKQRVHFSPAREGRPETASTSTEPPETASTSTTPSWGVPWKSVATLTVLGILGISLFPTTCEAHQILGMKPRGGGQLPTFPNFSPLMDFADLDGIEPLELDYDSDTILDCIADTGGPLEHDFEPNDLLNDSADPPEWTTHENGDTPRPPLAEPIGKVVGAPRRPATDEIEARRFRHVFKLLGERVSQRFASEPQLAATHGWTVAVDTESVQNNRRKQQLAQVCVVALPAFTVRYEALVKTDPHTIPAKLFKRDGVWVSGYLTYLNGLDKPDLDPASNHTKALETVLHEVDNMLRGADLVALAGHMDLLALGRRHYRYHHASLVNAEPLPVASFFELQEETQVRQWANSDGNEPPGLRKAFSGAFGIPPPEGQHDNVADAMMTLAVYARLKGIITPEMVEEAQRDYRRRQDAGNTPPERLRGEPPRKRGRRGRPNGRSNHTPPRQQVSPPRRRESPRPRQPSPVRSPVRRQETLSPRQRRRSPRPIPQERDRERKRSPSPTHYPLSENSANGWGLFERCDGTGPHRDCWSTTEGQRPLFPLATILKLWAQQNQPAGQSKGSRRAAWTEFIHDLQGPADRCLGSWRTRWATIYPDPHHHATPTRGIVQRALEQWKKCLKAREYLAQADAKPFRWTQTMTPFDDDPDTIGKEWAMALNAELAKRHNRQLKAAPHPFIGDTWSLRAHGEFTGCITQSGTLLRNINSTRQALYAGAKAFIIFTGLDYLRGTPGYETPEEHISRLEELFDALPRHAPAFYIDPPRVETRPTAWRSHLDAIDGLFRRRRDGPTRVALPAINHRDTGRTARARLIDAEGTLTGEGWQLIADQLADHGVQLAFREEAKRIKVRGLQSIFEPEEEQRPPIVERLRLMLPMLAPVAANNDNNNNNAAAQPGASRQPIAERVTRTDGHVGQEMQPSPFGSVAAQATRGEE